ncbi:hypothetical protein lerEdw1_014215, partial [Lerista edwardsae]
MGHNGSQSGAATANRLCPSFTCNVTIGCYFFLSLRPQEEPTHARFLFGKRRSLHGVAFCFLSSCNRLLLRSPSGLQFAAFPGTLFWGTLKAHAMNPLEIQELDLREMGAMIQSRVVVEVSSHVQSLLDSLETATLEIAVTGESGAGKSTFINALLGLSDGDPRAAPTGVIETTASPKPYRHPRLPTVQLWDLPGTGTPSFQAERYLQQVGLEKYDFFIIVTSERFRQNHAELARAVGAMGKRFYFVRTKVDQDIRASRQRRPTCFQEAQVLREIEMDCLRHLQKEGLGSPQVFLLSSFELHKFDFQRFQDTLAEELDGHKRHAL